MFFKGKENDLIWQITGAGKKRRTMQRLIWGNPNEVDCTKQHGNVHWGFKKLKYITSTHK